jgi:hypothetical protein
MTSVEKELESDVDDVEDPAAEESVGEEAIAVESTEVDAVITVGWPFASVVVKSSPVEEVELL